MIQGFATNSDIIELILKMHWSILHLEPPQGTVVTSDRPLLMTNGLDNFHGQLIFPLSPNCVFFAFRSRIRLKNLLAADPEILCEEINRWLIEQAFENVYAQDESRSSQIQNSLGKASKYLYVDYRQA